MCIFWLTESDNAGLCTMCFLVVEAPGVELTHTHSSEVYKKVVHWPKHLKTDKMVAFAFWGFSVNIPDFYTSNHVLDGIKLRMFLS